MSSDDRVEHRKAIIALLLIVLAFDAGENSQAQQFGGTDPQILQIDCTADNPQCQQIQISGDAPQDSKFHGYGDPTMRRDPNTGTLWLSYSWPKVVQTRRLFRRFRRPDVAVDIHLAQSNNDGQTWVYMGPLWQTSMIENPVTRTQNIISHEIANILPHDQGGETIWYGINFNYFVKPGSFIYSQWGRFSYFTLSRANSPEQLANAPSQMLGFARTAEELGPDVNLSSLHPDLAECIVWTEPSLTIQGNQLYLASRCMHASGFQMRPERDFYAIFSTQQQGNIDRWQWNYHGKLAGPREAAELGNSQFLTQFDFARKADGSLLAIVTVATAGGPQGELYDGCRVLQVSSLDPPALARDASGTLIVLAKITASDLESGTGSCTYEPSSPTGVILTRKLIKDPVQGYYWTLHETWLMP